MGPRDAKRIEQADGVGRHVLERIGHGGPAPGRQRGSQVREIRQGRGAEMRGAAGVPVVEAEDAIASSCGERLAKGRRPADPLGSEARDQQDGLVCRIAETVPHQVDAVGQPRPQRAPDRIGEVSLAELGAASVRDMKVEAPVAGLIDIVERRPVTANVPKRA